MVGSRKTTKKKKKKSELENLFAVNVPRVRLNRTGDTDVGQQSLAGRRRCQSDFNKVESAEHCQR